jgi:trigger factor
MHFNIEEVSSVEKKLAVEVEWPLVAAKLDAAYKELGRDVSIRGFRKGKVPRNILERMFARRVEEQVVRQLIQESLLRAAHQHSLEPVAEPIVDEVQMSKGSPFRYSARIEVRASLDPHGYDGVELEKPTPTVTVEEVDRALERKRQELSEYRQIEGRTELGPSDVVMCELRGEVGDRPFHQERAFVELSGTGNNEVIPGLGKALLGKPVTSTEPLALELDLPAEEGEPKGKKALLKVQIKDARERLVPALDDDFAKDTGEADTLDELRTKLREQLLVEKDKDVTRGLRSALIKELLKRNEFQVAPSLVERHSASMVERTKLTMAMQGLNMSAIGMDDEQMKDRLRPAAADEVRAAMLIDAIGTKENVAVTDAELEKHLAEMAKGRDTSVPRLKAELQKEGRYQSIKQQLREEKTLDLLLSRAKIVPTETSSPSEK